MLTELVVTAAVIGSLQQSVAPARYRITISADRSVESTTRGLANASASSSAASSATAGAASTYQAVVFVTVTRMPDAANAAVHVVIDSASCSGTGMMSMAFDSSVARKSRGISYAMTPGSSPQRLPTPSTVNPLSDVLAEAVAMLFPAEQSRPAPGVTWPDTLNLEAPGVPLQGGRVITRWKVVSAGADTAVVEGDVSGATSAVGRVVASGLLYGKRQMTLAAGVVRTAALSLHREMLMFSGEMNDPSIGRGTTTIAITRVR